MPRKRKTNNPSAIELHPDRASIEFQLARGTPVRVVAAQYGLSKSQCYRHMKKLPPQLIAALKAKALKPGVELDRLREEESQGLLQNLGHLRAKLLWAFDNSLEICDSEGVARLANQLHKNLELVGKYLGEFAKHEVHTQISILLSPEYLTLRQAIMQALAAHPDARRDVAAALHKLESKPAALPERPILENASHEEKAR